MSTPYPSMLWFTVHDKAMADSVLSQSSQDVLRRLDEQLKECTPLDECPGEQGYGLDYAVRMEEARKVSHSIKLCLAAVPKIN